MAENKKISELDQIQSLNDADEFVVVDKSTKSGKDASSSGKTTRVTLSQLKQAVSAAGAKGEKGAPGPQGAQGAQGARGPQGAQGAQGARGAQGAQGARGATGAQGSQGARGATGAAGAKGATGSKGSAGAKGATGPKGSTGAKGARGATGASGNSNPHLLWRGGNMAHDSSGQQLRKVSGGNGWATGYAYSQTGYTGGASISWRCASLSNHMMLGLSSYAGTAGNTSHRYKNIDYSFYCAKGNYNTRNKGNSYDGYKKYSVSDIFTITYDNHHVTFYINGAVIRRVTAGSGKKFHAYIAMHEQNSTYTNMFTFGPAGPRGSTGSKGARGATGAKGSTGPKGSTGAKGARGATGSSNLNAHLSLATSNAYISSSGQHIRKAAAQARDKSSWNSQVYSRVGYQGGCQVAFSTYGYVTLMLGLNQDPTKDASYTSIDFCWYVHENKNAYIYESGTSKGTYVTGYNPADTFTITYDNQHIRYMHNGTVKRTVSVGSNKKYHLDSSIHHHGKTTWVTDKLYFAPMAQRGPTGPKGSTGAKGARGATGPKGSSGAKGSTGPRGPQGKPEVTNYASDSSWKIQKGSQPGFSQNGTNKNQVVWGFGPFGERTKVWQSINNDTASTADGGWGRTITGLDVNKSYMNVVYVKRTSSATSGSFYHGPAPYGSKWNADYKGNPVYNPYHGAFGISALPVGVWCCSIGFVHAKNDTTTSNHGGLYRCDTGAKIRGYNAFKMHSTNSSGGLSGQRTYLYYSKDPKAKLEWCKPGFYEVGNPMAPSIQSLVQPRGNTGKTGNPNKHLGFVTSNMSISDDGQTFRKVGGYTTYKGNTKYGTWNTGSAYTTQWIRGGCSITFKVHDHNTAFMCGLSDSQSLTSSRYKNIDYAWYPTHSSGQAQIYESGIYRLGVTKVVDAKKGTRSKYSVYKAGDIFQITYDNAHVRYYHNGNLWRTISVGANRAFRAYVSVWDPDEYAMTAFNFAPMGGRGATGPRGATGAKGATGPRGSNSITTSTTITPGQIRFNNSTNSRLDDEGSWGFRSRTNSGYIQFGPANTGHAHIYTDRSNFYFNKELLYANGALMHHDRNNHRIKSERDGRNLVVNSRNVKHEAGISLRNSDNKWHGFQLYAAGSYYGFLNADWSSWDLQKKKNSELVLRIGTTYRTAYHTGNLNAVRKGFPGASSSHFGLNGWIEYTGTHAGLYWGNGSSAKGWHLYPVNTTDMYVRSGHSTNVALRFTCNNGTARGYVYADHGNNIGFLNNIRHWRFRISANTNHIHGGHSSVAKNNYSPNLYFEEGGVRNWTGQPGANRGKIEYHSNRFYIVAGSNSNRIVQFRRDGSDKSYIDNNGYFVGPVYSTALHVQGGLAIRNGRSDYQTHINSDKNGFTRVYGQYGVGFLGHGATAGGEMGRFTSVGTDLKNSTKLTVGVDRGMGRIDICKGGSLFSQKDTHLNNLYISRNVKFRHDTQRWYYAEKSNGNVFALGRDGYHFYHAGARSAGDYVRSYTEDFRVSTNGYTYVRRGYLRLSDVREKENINSLNNKKSLDQIMKLRPVSFKWKDDREKGLQPGLIAQEVEKILPSVVIESEGGTGPAGVGKTPTRKSVDYDELVPVLISAVQQQQKQINELKKQIKKS